MRQPAVRDINAALLRGEKDAVCARRWQLDADAMRRHRVKGTCRRLARSPALTREPGRPARLDRPVERRDGRTLGETVRNAIIMIGSDARAHGDKRLAPLHSPPAMDAIEEAGAHSG